MQNAIHEMAAPPEGFLSAADDPDRANALAQQVMSSSAAEPARIPPPPDAHVELPGGFLLPDGREYRTATVRELTGEDEERLARVNAVKNPGRFMNTLVRCGVEAFGDDTPSSEHFDALLLGDRDYLILAIRRATFGDEVRLEVRCPNCEHEFGVSVSLSDDVPVKRLDSPSDRFFRVELKDGDIAHVALPTAADQESILSDDKLTVPEQNTLLLRRCVSMVGLDPVSTLTQIKALSMADRRKILSEIRERQTGPQYEEVRQDCPKCAEEFPLVLDLIDLFR